MTLLRLLTMADKCRDESRQGELKANLFRFGLGRRPLNAVEEILEGQRVARGKQGLKVLSGT